MSSNQLCRTCLGQEIAFLSIFSSEEVADMIGFITDVTPFKSDGMPETVCEDCFTSLKKFYSFKSKCLTSHTKLTNILKAPKESQDSLSTYKSSIQPSSKEALVVPKEEKDVSDFSDDFKIKTEEEDPDYSDFTMSNVNQENKIDLKEEDDAENATYNSADGNIHGSASDDNESEGKDQSESKEENQCESEIEKDVPMPSKGNIPNHQSISVDLIEQGDDNNSIQLEVRCPQCNKGYKHLSRLKDHMKTHSTEKPYNCSICGKAFKHQFTLRRHMSLHKTSVPCEAINPTDSIDAHPEFTKEDKKIQSPIIENQEKNNSIDDSQKLKLPEKQSEFQCTQGCTKVFKNRSMLNRHMKIHSSDKLRNHVCNKCGKSYTKSSHLKNHIINVHTNIKGFKCEQCGQLFARNSCLQRHIRVHTGDRPHICEICHKGFPHAFTLEAHKRVHSEERPFKCDVCPMQFKLPGGLREHMRRHTGERPFSCKICPRKLSSKANYEIHMKTHDNCKDIQNSFLTNQVSGSSPMDTEPVEELQIKDEIQTEML